MEREKEKGRGGGGGGGKKERERGRERERERVKHESVVVFHKSVPDDKHSNTQYIKQEYK